MRQLRQTLRLHLEAGLSIRDCSRVLGIGKSTISDVVRYARAAGVDWGLAQTLSDEELDARLYRPAVPRSARHLEPDFARIHQELKRPGVTLQLLWEEYVQANALAYKYTSFCVKYREWAERLKRSMRQIHVAGDKLFADYAGQMVPIIDAGSGEISQAQIFVAALGASNYTYVCATRTQTAADWVGSLIGALEFIGGAAALDRSRPAARSHRQARSLRARRGPSARGVLRPLRRGGACRRGPLIRGTSPRSSARCSWSSAGSWPGCATAASSAWPSSTARSRELVADLNTASLQEAARLPARGLREARRTGACGRCRPRGWPSCASSVPASTSTTTSSSTATTTACRTGWCVPRSNCASAARRWRPSLASSAWPCTPTAPSRAASRPNPSTCRLRTARTSSGRRPSSSPGASASARHCGLLVRWQMEHRPHPEQGYRSCLGLKRLARQLRRRSTGGGVRAGDVDPLAHLPQRRRPSSRAAWTASPCGPSPPRARCRCTRTCAAPTTTTETVRVLRLDHRIANKASTTTS